MFAMSEFDGTRSLGILVSVTLLVAMFTNLMLLPSLLMSFAQFVTPRPSASRFLTCSTRRKSWTCRPFKSKKAQALGRGRTARRVAVAGPE